MHVMSHQSYCVNTFLDKNLRWNCYCMTCYGFAVFPSNLWWTKGQRLSFTAYCVPGWLLPLNVFAMWTCDRRVMFLRRQSAHHWKLSRVGIASNILRLFDKVNAKFQVHELQDFLIRITQRSRQADIADDSDALDLSLSLGDLLLSLQ